MALCSVKSGSMDPYDFNALQLIMNMYDLTREEEEYILDGIGIIGVTTVELEENARERQDRLESKFEGKKKPNVHKR